MTWRRATGLDSGWEELRLSSKGCLTATVTATGGIWAATCVVSSKWRDRCDR
jgi:hypothetical protein